VVKVVLSRRTRQRRAAFSDQLEQTLQIISSGLRAGHSIPHALDATSREADAPMGPELARIVNENRLGRDLIEAMRQTAVRMDNEDFAWVSDAVSIQRDTGGNLSTIIDRVAETIRIRSEIRAQVHALSAEGRISALVLMTLPLIVAGMYTLLNPSYMSLLVNRSIGQFLLAGCAVLYVVAFFWLRALVKVEI
jgi:tight adherence protein B